VIRITTLWAIGDFMRHLKGRLIPPGGDIATVVEPDDREVPNHGPCAYCGRPVIHHYPWFTANPYRGGRPLHDECHREIL
jgi:hypothetical protein